MEEQPDEERQRLLESLEDEDLEREPAHITVAGLADETATETALRLICYAVLVYGMIGGFVSFLVTSTRIFEDMA